MKITENLSMTKRTGDGSFYGERNGRSYVIPPMAQNYNIYSVFYDTMRRTPFERRAEIAERLLATTQYAEIMSGAPVATTTRVTPVKQSATEALLDGIQKMMDFFSEFSFTPSFRFTNTFAFMAQKSANAAREYVRNYFALMDSSYQNDVNEKIKSGEFSKIISLITQYGAPKDTINTRLKIYFGSAGTGKTTLAQQEADNRCIVCNSSMLPADLMEDFIFRDGNPDFNPSLLWDCMEQGKIIVLDEINLLPFDSLRFLQGLVDGKSEFYYKNRPVHIHDGFQIIGTMNLSLGGMTYGLPEPLVDRCCETREFMLTPEQLATAIMGRKDD